MAQTMGGTVGSAADLDQCSGRPVKRRSFDARQWLMVNEDFKEAESSNTSQSLFLWCYW